ncbi:hypothetical protein DIE06_28765 [Burkholderia sp. Bp8998]|nr:hypothetical protein DIE06_28765 [Burkholderia sp. Bp8998]
MPMRCDDSVNRLRPEHDREWLASSRLNAFARFAAQAGAVFQRRGVLRRTSLRSQSSHVRIAASCG